MSVSATLPAVTTGSAEDATSRSLPLMTPPALRAAAAADAYEVDEWERIHDIAGWRSVFDFVRGVVANPMSSADVLFKVQEDLSRMANEAAMPPGRADGMTSLAALLTRIATLRARRVA